MIRVILHQIIVLLIRFAVAGIADIKINRFICSEGDHRMGDHLFKRDRTSRYSQAADDPVALIVADVDLTGRIDLVVGGTGVSGYIDDASALGDISRNGDQSVIIDRDQRIGGAISDCTVIDGEKSEQTGVLHRCFKLIGIVL